NLTPERRDALGAMLGIPEATLSALHIGYLSDPLRPCWTFAEMDAAGKPIGIVRRFGDGKKVCIEGSKRGLTIPAKWQERPGPIHIPEGASCTLALSAMGLPAVGRPSN